MVHHVVVTFPEGIPSCAQSEALMEFERILRILSGMDCRVVKDKMPDDSKLRMMREA